MAAPTMSQLFALPELLSIIFAYLEPTDLLRNVQRVCKQWHEVINDKPDSALKRALYLEPVTDSRWQYDATKKRDYGHEGLDGLPTGHIIIDDLSQAEYDFLMERNRFIYENEEPDPENPLYLTCFKPIAAVDINEAVFEPGWQTLWESEAAWPDHAVWAWATYFKLGVNPGIYPQGRWTEQLISQPPPKSIEVWVHPMPADGHWCADLVGPRCQACEPSDRYNYSILQFDGSQTLGQIVEEIEKVTKEDGFVNLREMVGSRVQQWKVDWVRTQVHLIHATRKTEELVDAVKRNAVGIKEAYTVEQARQELAQEES